MTPPPKTARQIAFDVLQQWRQTGKFAGPLLETAFSRTNNLLPADRGLSSELVYLSLIHISEPTSPRLISYAVFC